MSDDDKPRADKMIRVDERQHAMIAELAEKERRTLAGQLGIVIDEWFAARQRER